MYFLFTEGMTSFPTFYSSNAFLLYLIESMDIAVKAHQFETDLMLELSYIKD